MQKPNRVDGRIVLEGHVCSVGTEWKSNSSQESIRLPPWQLNVSREKQKPKLFIGWLFTCCLGKKKYHGSAVMKGTLFWQASSSPVNHRNTRTASRLNIMQHVFDGGGDVSFEREKNPDHLWNISLSLWRCQDGHVRCDGGTTPLPQGAEMWTGAGQSSCKRTKTDTWSPLFKQQPSVSWDMIKNAFIRMKHVCLDYTLHANDHIRDKCLCSVLNTSTVD